MEVTLEQIIITVGVLLLVGVTVFMAWRRGQSVDQALSVAFKSLEQNTIVINTLAQLTRQNTEVVDRAISLLHASAPLTPIEADDRFLDFLRVVKDRSTGVVSTGSVTIEPPAQESSTQVAA